jgi:hypothetical protein
MKDGEMGRNAIAIGGVMRAPQLIEPSVIGAADLRGDDQRAGH